MGKVKREFWGLDLETSGTSHQVSVPIQIGIAAPNGALFSSLIGGWKFDEMYHVWDEEAYQVHKIEQGMLASAPAPAVVCDQALDFIKEHSGTNWRGARKVVGWNVASFDMPFVRKYLPAISDSLSYQSADLNAVTFAISEAQGISYKNLKRTSKTYAESGITALGVFPEGMWHDAGFDALAALYSWEYLLGRIKEGY